MEHLYQKISAVARASFESDEVYKDFYKKYKKDVQDRIERLTHKFEYSLDYKI